MRFRDAVDSTPSIRGFFRDGLQAIRNVDRDRLRCSMPRNLRGSVDVDSALKPTFPSDSRWDYAIAIRRRSRPEYVIWLEVHPASSRHVDEVLRKLQWLKDWLETAAPAMRGLPGEFRWVSTGRVAFRRGSREEKRIAQKGLRFPTKQLDLDTLR
jgi:hypothetical protein